MNNRMQQFKPGDFSLGQAHAFLGAYGKQGGTPEMLQRAFEDQELMKRIVRYMRSGGYEPSTDQRVAKVILGEGNFFGPAEWVEHFGSRAKFTKAQLTKAATIPRSEESLRKSTLGQPEFMFLGVEKLEGKKLNLPLLHTIYPGPNHPKFYLEWYLNHAFAQGTCQFRWYSMTVGIVQYSYSKSFGDQEAMLPPEYEVPTATERVLGNILFYLLNRKYLDEGMWARTRSKSGEKEESGDRVSVVAYSDYGVHVDLWDDGPHSHVGVAASKKFIDS